jgi:hypothetical protein
MLQSPAKIPTVELRQTKTGAWMVFVDSYGQDLTVYRVDREPEPQRYLMQGKLEVIQGGKDRDQESH